MALSKLPPQAASAFYYTPILSQTQEPNYIVLPFYRRPSGILRRTLSAASFLLLNALLAYVLWPSDPSIKITKVACEVWSIPRIKHLLDSIVSLRDDRTARFLETLLSMRIKEVGI